MDEWKKIEKEFAQGMHAVQLLLIATLLFGALLAGLVLLLGPVGSLAIPAAVIIALVIVGLLFAKPIQKQRVRRKKIQSGTHCAFCKDLLAEKSTNVCPGCGSIQHEDCFNINGGCSTFSCKHASKNITSESMKHRA